MATGVASISRIYRCFFLYIEPISALTGAYYSSCQQRTYLALTHSSSAPEGVVPIGVQIVLAQLANMYFLFAINEAIILRATPDLKVWRAVLLCLLIADFGHLYSVKSAGWHIYWHVLGWNAIDFGNVAFVYVGASMRVAFLLGFGIGQSGRQATERSTRRKRPSSRNAG
jgi:hypothetical protein